MQLHVTVHWTIYLQATNKSVPSQIKVALAWLQYARPALIVHETTLVLLKESSLDSPTYDVARCGDSKVSMNVQFVCEQSEL